MAQPEDTLSFVDVRLIPYNKGPFSNNTFVTDDTFSHPTCLDLMVPCQVTNNPPRADELLKRADDVEEATTSNAHKVDTKTRLVLMGRGDSAESMREMVSKRLDSELCLFRLGIGPGYYAATLT
jgi:hypothetical protein